MFGLPEPPIDNPPVALPQSEFDRWLREPRILLTGTGSVGALEWWRVNHTRFPRLSEFAKRYLAVPASAAPVERVWSTAGRLVVTKRLALHPDTIAEQVFLHENSDLL